MLALNADQTTREKLLKNVINIIALSETAFALRLRKWMAEVLL